MSFACFVPAILSLIAAGAVIGTLIGVTVRSNSDVPVPPSPTGTPTPSPTPLLSCPLLAGAEPIQQPIVLGCGRTGDTGTCEFNADNCVIRAFESGDVPNQQPEIVATCNFVCEATGQACNCGESNICVRNFGNTGNDDDNVNVRCE